MSMRGLLLGGWLALALLAACAPTRRACERSYGPCGPPALTRITRQVDTTILRSAARITDTLRLRDTLALRDTITLQDATGRARLRYWRTRAGRLQAQCQALPETLRIRQQMIREVQVPAKPRARAWWQPWAPWALAALAVALGLYALRRLLP